MLSKTAMILSLTEASESLPAFWVSSLESAMAIVVAGLFPGFKLFSGPVGAHLLSTIQHP